MPEIPEGGEGSDLQALDAATSEARSVARRAFRLAERLARLHDEGLAAQGQVAADAVQRLLEAVEVRRAEERRRLRRRLRGDPNDDGP